MVLKGLIELAIATPIGGKVVTLLGSTTAIPSGIRSATQSLTSLGLAGKAASLSKGFFK